MEMALFKELVFEALEDLPEEFARKMDNIDIVIEAFPSKDVIEQIGARSGGSLLGLYQGVPLNRRTAHYGMVMPDKITLFKANIERICFNQEEVKKAVKKTVIHEIAHHFGISDRRLKELNLY